jgi:cytochrome c
MLWPSKLIPGLKQLVKSALALGPTLWLASVANGADLEHGRQLALQNCAGCHAVAFEDESPNARAPAFRDLSERVPVDTIDEMLLVKLSPRHTDMPTFEITTTQAADIAGYIASIQPVAHGRTLVEKNCAPCHSIEMTGKSPHPDAPPFRTLSRNYPVSALEEALAEGIVTGHPDMPEFSAEPRQVADIISFLESIQEH